MLSGMPPTAAGAGSAMGGAFLMGGAFFLPRANLQDLLDILREDGRRLIGPTIAERRSSTLIAWVRDEMDAGALTSETRA